MVTAIIKSVRSESGWKYRVNGPVEKSSVTANRTTVWRNKSQACALLRAIKSNPNASSGESKGTRNQGVAAR